MYDKAPGYGRPVDMWVQFVWFTCRFFQYSNRFVFTFCVTTTIIKIITVWLGGIMIRVLNMQLVGCRSDLLSSNNSGQVVRMCAFVTEQCNLILVKEWWCSAVNEDLTAGLADVRKLAVWFHLVVSVLVSISEVALHRVWLVLGWVTVCWQVSHLGMYSVT